MHDVPHLPLVRLSAGDHDGHDDDHDYHDVDHDDDDVDHDDHDDDHDDHDDHLQPGCLQVIMKICKTQTHANPSDRIPVMTFIISVSGANASRVPT